MKKTLIILFSFILLGAGVSVWVFLGPATAFPEKHRSLFISSKGATKAALLDTLQKNHFITNTRAFVFLADRLDLWHALKPGKYEIKHGASLLTLVRKLRNGQQTPVNLVITKLRTPEDFARLVGRHFECDSAQVMGFLKSPDSLAVFGVDTATAFTRILPDTYTFFWNTTPERIYTKLSGEASRFWNEARTVAADSLGLTPVTAYILASIVEEETRNLDEKDTIASVYLNRIARGMPLQADPTVKFALKDFALTRIYGAHLNTPSPYNTYRNRGLPPGPIATPSKKTIDAVLAAPKTDYIYFVANPRLNGTHTFSATYAEHQQKARAYQQAYKVWAAARSQKSAGDTTHAK